MKIDEMVVGKEMYLVRDFPKGRLGEKVIITRIEEDIGDDYNIVVRGRSVWRCCSRDLMFTKPTYRMVI